MPIRTFLALNLTVTLSAAGCGGPRANPPASPPVSAHDAAYERCMGYGGAAPQNCEAYAQQQAGPANEVAVDSPTWFALDQGARDVIGDPEAPVAHLEARGFMIQQPLQVEGGNCYQIGLAWASGRETLAAIGFFQNPDGSWPNTQMQGRSFHVSPPASKLEFCVDNPGRAQLTLTATEGGVMVQNAQLQYAMAIVARSETPQERAARQQTEIADVAAGRRQVETNLQMADQRSGGAAFARSCARCRAAYYECSEGNTGNDCNLGLQTCAQALGTDRSGRILCARP